MYDQYLKLATGCGFSAAACFAPEKLAFATADVLRGACEQNSCTMYGRFWTCPPAVGSVEECIRQVKSYRRGLALQLVSEAVSYAFNEELFNEVRDTFNYMTREIWRAVRQDYPDALAIGMSGCTLCKNCAWPKAPCRHPDEMIRCISAYCIDLHELSELCGFTHASPEESEYFSIILFDQKA
jgi:predicted metal-binding protein